MAIIRNDKKGVGAVKSSSPIISKEEALFIASKLQQANYKGIEFETYNQVLIKLRQIIDNQ